MLFENKVSDSIEVKGYIDSPSISFAEYLYNSGYYDLSALAAIRMYKDCVPFYVAVDMRATHFSQIPIRLWDKRKEEFVDDHEVLDLLKQPNGDTTGNEFLYAFSSFFDITGNSFLYAGGRIERPPLELVTVAPQNFVFPSPGNRFGILNVPDTIQYNSYNSAAEIFRPEEDRNTGLIRFIGGRDLRDREIWHVRNFNPTRNNGSFWGMSKAQPAFLEIQQYLSGNTTNWMMLKRGTRLSMAWVNNRGEELTETQYQRLLSEQAKYSGDKNAGGNPILDGVDVKPINSTFKDMEFKDLQANMFERVNTIYQIPLPLLSTETMTLDNLKTAMLQLYDRAVLPLTKYLYSELERFLLPRYKNTEDLKFSYSDTDITALMERNIEVTLKKGQIGVNTIDELRSDVGDKPLPNGDGDVVYRPVSEVPIGGDTFIAGDIEDPDNLNE